MIYDVSIPYERESTCELPSNEKIEFSFKFQFPTNGKVHVNPFNRDSIDSRIVFQFPTNGKVHVNRVAASENDVQWEIGFQFPTNGKVHVNSNTLTVVNGSEKFQFPTNGKVHVNTYPTHTRNYYSGFNSLRTGKYM